MKNLRLIAASVIDKVTDGHSLSEVLPPALSTIANPRDKSFVQSICYGVCRFYYRLDVVLSHLLQKPLKAKDSDVHALILVGLYQLMEMRVPAHAAVAETVNAVQALKKSWARGFVNALLREYIRQEQAIQKLVQEDEEARYAHPQWLISHFEKAWPEHSQSMLEANNTHPSFSLRVNAMQGTRENYLKVLQEQGINAVSSPETKHGIILESPIPVEQLPGFATGSVSVQDGAAQLAAELLSVQPNQNVLDACAAPGGKFMHILELQPNLQSAVAIEIDSQRMKSIEDNLQRLQLSRSNVKLICQDALDVEEWWDGQLFDRILLDAPCSATGVIRRHPDIKLLRQPHDIKSLAKLQRALLEELWPLLTPGGLLLYATCSVLPEENVAVVEDFLAHHPEAREEKFDVTWGVECKHGRQILPGMQDMDGFYYAGIRK
jgi:16S rRNA (cytosine967-C5)-methyltransferase